MTSINSAATLTGVLPIRKMRLLVPIKFFYLNILHFYVHHNYDMHLSQPTTLHTHHQHNINNVRHTHAEQNTRTHTNNKHCILSRYKGCHTLCVASTRKEYFYWLFDNRKCLTRRTPNKSTFNHSIKLPLAI